MPWRRSQRMIPACLALAAGLLPLLGCRPAGRQADARPAAESVRLTLFTRPGAGPGAALPLPAPEPSFLEPPPVPPEPAGPVVRQICGQIAAKLGSVSLPECLASRLEASSGISVEGLPILVREYPPRRGLDPLGRVLMVGGIHGDEFSSVSIVFKWMSILDVHHSGMFHWRVAPLLNPDGLLRAKSQRLNANGVDLNRNFPSPNWLEETRDYWVRRTSRNPRRYPGPTALSEPESRWLAGEIEAFRPDVVVAVHAPYSVLDFDGPPKPPDRLGPLFLHLLGTYPGSLGRFAGVHGGLPVVTIELPSAGIMPTPAEQNAMWSDLIDWLRKRLVDGRRPPTRAAR